MMHDEMIYLMSVFYITAGMFHFVKPGIYRSIMPAWIPWHNEIILISGIAEIALGILLIPAQTRTAAAGLIIFLLIIIFPANIQMAINWNKQKNPRLWIALCRLPLQLLLIWWAWQYTR